MTHEDEVRQLRAQLTAKDEELNGFLYRASHDLQGPVRRVRTFATFLAEADEDGATEEERAEFLEFILASTRDLQGLLDGLLALSRARNNPVTLVPGVSVAACARAAAEGLPMDGVPIQWHPLPTLESDPAALRSIYAALLENALLWSGSGDDLAITLSAEPSDGGWLLGVEDNGVGIPEPQRERAQRAFERLGDGEGGHPGLGLSVVSALAEALGGRAWVEGADGGGVLALVWLPGGAEAEQARAPLAPPRL